MSDVRQVYISAVINVLINECSNPSKASVIALYVCKYRNIILILLKVLYLPCATCRQIRKTALRKTRLSSDIGCTRTQHIGEMLSQLLVGFSEALLLFAGSEATFMKVTKILHSNLRLPILHLIKCSTSDSTDMGDYGVAITFTVSSMLCL